MPVVNNRELTDMEAKFKVNDKFRLKAAHTFTRSFPHGGYKQDGSVGEGDKTHVREGSIGKVSDIFDSHGPRSKAWYWVDFGDFKLNVDEAQLLELFDPANES
jgi:uncharacterized protein YidB (DUF937 family)